MTLPFTRTILNMLVDDHLILRGGGGGAGIFFFQINILTLKMLEINNMSSSGKKINNLTLTCFNLGEKRNFFQKNFRSLRSRQFNFNFSDRFTRIKLLHVRSQQFNFNLFLLSSLAFNYNMNVLVS